MKDNIFRAYDIRGKYPTEINEDIAYTIGIAYGSYLKEKYNQTKCVISHDNRLSSVALNEALTKGLLDSGIDIIDYGLTTTPMNYYARHINNCFGLMITASHNPKEDNGFKFSFDEYTNARGQMIQDFKNYIKEGNFLNGFGKLEYKKIKNEYFDYIINNINLGKKKIKVVLDPANGTTTCILNEIFQKFNNIDFTIINEKSDGSFPNHHPDPSIENNLSQLKEKVLELKADVGIGFDGDGDRIGIVDEKGNFVQIEGFAILVLRDIFDKVKNKKFLYDAKCSDNFKDEVNKLGGIPVISQTGTSYTQYNTLKDNLPFGFQYVGHISFNDRLFSTESAIYSALRLIELLSKSDKTLSQMISTVPKYFSSEEERIPSSDDKKLEVIKNIKEYCNKKNFDYTEIDGLKIQFKRSWAYVRASNTGPNITLRCESKDEKTLNELIENMHKVIDFYNK